MAFLARCPWSECRSPKRVDPLPVTGLNGIERVAAAARVRCNRCLIWYCAVIDRDGVVSAYEDW